MHRQYMGPFSHFITSQIKKLCRIAGHRSVYGSGSCTATASCSVSLTFLWMLVLDATVIYRRHACRYACLLSSEKGVDQGWCFRAGRQRPRPSSGPFVWDVLLSVMNLSSCQMYMTLHSFVTFAPHACVALSSNEGHLFSSRATKGRLHSKQLSFFEPGLLSKI